MPSSPLIRYNLDPTGQSPDNFINGEVKTLSISPLRAIAPAYGPFYSETLYLYDHGTGGLLLRGRDYQIVDLLQSATLKFGKEIAQIVLITNQSVSNQVRLNYQCLGGLYQNNAEGLVDLYNTVMADARTVDWTQVLNKPTEYTPTLHRHLLDDVYGFEPIVVELERIRNAIILSDVPAFEALIQWVKDNTIGNVFTSPVIPLVNRSDLITFNVTTSHVHNGEKLYWSIVHHGTRNINFTTKSGEMTIFQNQSSFSVKMSSRAPIRDKTFDIIIRKDNPNGLIATTIEGITYNGQDDRSQSIIQLLNTCCITEPGKVTARSLFMLGDK